MSETTLTIQEKVLAHIQDKENPHNIRKGDLRLGLVQNFKIPTEEESISGSLPDRYITPANLKDLFKGLLIREGLMDNAGNVILP